MSQYVLQYLIPIRHRQSTRSVAEQAADRRLSEYDELTAACRSRVTCADKWRCFPSDLGREISERSGDPLDVHFYFNQWVCWSSVSTRS